MTDENNLYVILNIKPNATYEDIKKSYRKLVLKYHPDKHTNDNTNYYNKKFIDIQNAFEILSDKNKRTQYDLENLKLNEKLNTKSKIKEFVNFINNPTFYLLFFDKLLCSNFDFVSDYVINSNMFKILDITFTIKFTLSEYYNVTPKYVNYLRNTREEFQEIIFAIDNKQIYENEGEIINIDNVTYYGNFIININIENNKNYSFIENDLILFIKKNNIKKNKIKFKHLDNKKYSFNIHELRQLNSSNDLNNFNNQNNIMKNYTFDSEYKDTKNKKSDIIYYIDNMGLPYFENDNNIYTNGIENIDFEINNLDIRRGKLFFIFL